MDSRILREDDINSNESFDESAELISEESASAELSQEDLDDVRETTHPDIRRSQPIAIIYPKVEKKTFSPIIINSPDGELQPSPMLLFERSREFQNLLRPGEFNRRRKMLDRFFAGHRVQEQHQRGQEGQKDARQDMVEGSDQSRMNIRQ